MGIITVATIIAAAAVGAYVIIVGGQGNFASLADRPVWSVAIFVSLVGILVSYLAVVSFGMSTFFLDDAEDRHG